MKPTVTLRWKTVGFGAMIGLGLLLAIMPSRLAGASLETRLADVSASMPERGFVVPPGELADWIVDARPLLVVDVREHWAYDEYHVEGAEHRFLADLVAPASVKALPDERPIVVIGEEAAAQATAILRLAGKEAYTLEGGIAAWWREVLTPASADPSIPETDRPSVAARRLAWRARFLGSAAAVEIVPSAPSRPGPTAPKPAGKPPTRGKGC